MAIAVLAREALMVAMICPEPVEPREFVEATSEEAERFYVDALGVLRRHGLPFLIGGSYALHHFTGIGRRTKDLDVFLHPRDVTRVLATFHAAGYQAEVCQPHWLAKVYSGDDFIDVIYGSGSGNRPVSDVWFTHATGATILGVPVELTACEEMLWSKAFVMERERFDGADIAHIILRCGRRMDWARVLEHFGSEWRVLLGHLVFFGFAYPHERGQVPEWLVRELLARLDAELVAPPPSDERLCQGTLLSVTQYKVDVQAWGFRDARVGHRVVPVIRPDEPADR
jgi:hypothetical protein